MDKNLTIKRAAHQVDGAYNWAILDSQKQIVAETFGKTSENQLQPAEEYARLFAASPSVLQALKQMSSEFQRLCVEPFYGEPNETLNEALNAIRLAEGK